MVLKLSCQGMCVARTREIWFTGRGVTGSQDSGNFLLASVFCWNWKIGLTAKSQIATTIANHSKPPKSTKSFPVVTIMKRRKETKREKTNIGVGTSNTVKVGNIDEKIREGQSRGMRKDLVGLYYLAHIASFLVLSQFWWLVPVFSIVYRWWTPVEVSSETPIYVLTILFHLSVFPHSRCCLMMVWKIFNSAFSVDMGSGRVP